MSEQVFETLKRLRTEYPTPMEKGQQAELLNRVAWTYRVEGWGLLSKTAGNKCQMSNGSEVACDILFNRFNGHHYDVLADVENTATPVWRDVGPIDLNRFVSPIEPNIVTPPPPPNPPIDDLEALKRRVDNLDNGLQNIASVVSGLHNVVDRLGTAVQLLNQSVVDLERMITQVDARIDNMRCEASARIYGITIPVRCEIKK